MEHTNRTSTNLEISPDAMEDLMDLPLRHVPDADRMIEKIAAGSVEGFVRRSRRSHLHENKWYATRGKVELTCFVDGPQITITGARIK
jgi:hypothetical protein